METNLHKSSRPLAVNLALILLLINLGTALAQQAIGADWRGADWSNPLVYVKWGSELFMIAALLWFIFRGKNWARWLLVVFACAGLCFSVPQLIQDFGAHSLSWVVDYFQRNLISAVALIALFLPSSSQWFRGHVIAMQA